MSRIQLRSGDIALLGRLNGTPLEIGDLPGDSVVRLSALGLVRMVLGSCEITRAGQLTFQRHQFLRASGSRIARVTRRNPLFLQEMRYGAPVNRTRLMDFIRQRRASDVRIRVTSLMPRWLLRLVSSTAERMRPAPQATTAQGGDVRS